MITPFMVIERVETDHVVEVKSALDNLLMALHHFIEMEADIDTEEDGIYTDIKMTIRIKGVK